MTFLTYPPILPEVGIFLEPLLFSKPCFEGILISYRSDEDICHSLQNSLPKLAGKLKILRLHRVHITHQCMDGITQLLKSSLDQIHFSQSSFTDLNELITALSNSNLRHLSFYDHYPFNLTIAKSLGNLLTMTNISLEDIKVGESKNILGPFDLDEFPTIGIDCGTARVLIEAMPAHSSGQHKIPVLTVCVRKSCISSLEDILYPRDKVNTDC